MPPPSHGNCHPAAAKYIGFGAKSLVFSSFHHNFSVFHKHNPRERSYTIWSDQTLVPKPPFLRMHFWLLHPLVGGKDESHAKDQWAQMASCFEARSTEKLDSRPCASVPSYEIAKSAEKLPPEEKDVVVISWRIFLTAKAIALHCTSVSWDVFCASLPSCNSEPFKNGRPLLTNKLQALKLNWAICRYCHIAALQNLLQLIPWSCEHLSICLVSIAHRF